METTNEISNLTVSYQNNTWSEITIEPTVEMVLNDIRSDKHKNQITILRTRLKNGDKDFYDNYKKQLPAVTFSATFNSKRTNENLKQYNSLIVIDIDKLTEKQIFETSNQLLKDEYVISFWRSPSNNGFKGLVLIDYKIGNEEIHLDVLHKSAFKKLFDYFLNNYNIELDKSGSDITRLCFLSFDNELVFKKSFKKFRIKNEDILFSTKLVREKKSGLKFTSSKDVLNNPAGKNNPLDRKLMTDIIRYLTNKNKTITFSYEEWCKVAMSIANTFTYDIGLNYFLKLSRLDTTKFNEVSCTNFLNNCYETRKGNVNFSSIIYLANQKGYKTKNQKNGVPKVEG